jgi:CheY-like chemotaxis protein
MAQTVPILLVEDDEVDAEAVRRALKKANVPNPLYKVQNGAEALDVLSGQNGRERLPQPCLLLVDINMPRMNGFELIEHMRLDRLMKKNIVFMLTTSARDEDKTQAYNLHTAGYILKENLNELASILNQYCEINEFPSSSSRPSSSSCKDAVRH